MDATPTSRRTRLHSFAPRAPRVRRPAALSAVPLLNGPYRARRPPTLLLPASRRDGKSQNLDDHDFLGTHETTMGTIVGGRGSTLQVPLTGTKGPDAKRCAFVSPSALPRVRARARARGIWLREGGNPPDACALGGCVASVSRVAPCMHIPCALASRPP